jgi:signal transduction histidine kinase
MLRLNLLARTFLLSFVPVCLLLLSTFLAIHRVTHERIRKELRESIYESGRLLDRAHADLSRDRKVLLAKLTDSAGLKASVGLLAETGKDQTSTEQARATIQAQLAELQGSTRFSYLAISDSHRRLVASLPSISEADGRPEAMLPNGGLFEINGSLYESESVPIEIGGEVAATLTVGETFDLKRLAIGGDAMLLKSGRPVRSTFAPKLLPDIVFELKTTCLQPDAGCEMSIDGHSYVASTLQSAHFGEYKIIVFRSLDASLNAFNRSFVPKLVEIASFGIVFAFLCTLTTSRSVTRPLLALSSQFESAAESGELPEKLDSGHGVREIELVATSFNRLSATERRSRNELLVAKRVAERANRLKTEFLSNVSHELKTPLNGVVGMAEMMTTTVMTGEQAEYIDVIRSCSTSLLRLIDEVLDFSELETGRLRVRRSSVNVHGVLDDIAAAVRTSAVAKPINVQISAPSQLDERCLGDEKRIRQILMHLCENAMKYTEAGFIRIGAECERKSASKGVLTFAVEDSGIGVAQENLELIFQPFTQVDGSSTRRQGGTGVGLSIVKGVVELMGGRVGVSSTLHVGSKFWFALPVDFDLEIEAHRERELLSVV